jgi:hypothetical protein
VILSDYNTECSKNQKYIFRHGSPTNMKKIIKKTTGLIGGLKTPYLKITLGNITYGCKKSTSEPAVLKIVK